MGGPLVPDLIPESHKMHQFAPSTGKKNEGQKNQIEASASLGSQACLWHKTRLIYRLFLGLKALGYSYCLLGLAIDLIMFQQRQANGPIHLNQQSIPRHTHAAKSSAKTPYPTRSRRVYAKNSFRVASLLKAAKILT